MGNYTANQSDFATKAIPFVASTVRRKKQVIYLNKNKN